MFWHCRSTCPRRDKWLRAFRSFLWNMGKQYFEFLLNLIKLVISNGPDKKEGTKGNEHVGMHKGTNFTIVSTKFLLGLILLSNQLPYNKISS